MLDVDETLLSVKKTISLAKIIRICKLLYLIMES